MWQRYGLNEYPLYHNGPVKPCKQHIPLKIYEVSQVRSLHMTAISCHSELVRFICNHHPLNRRVHLS